MPDDTALAPYLQMDADDLLAEIAIAADPDAALHSPDALLAKGRAVLAELRPRLRALVCPHRELLDGPEAQLALAVSGYLLGGIPAALVQPIAVYLVKRGLRLLCTDEDIVP
jgi:hypothetical protein